MILFYISVCRKEQTCGSVFFKSELLSHFCVILFPNVEIFGNSNEGTKVNRNESIKNKLKKILWLE